jgi:acid phosphatase family membrane protein YuiD
MVGVLFQVIANRIVWAAVLAWIVAQGIKIILLYRKNRKMDYHWIVKTGSMPSSHSAFLSAVSLSILFTEGVTTSFILAVCVSIAIMRLLVIKKYNGHSPKEILVGTFLGILCSLISLL